MVAAAPVAEGQSFWASFSHAYNMSSSAVSLEVPGRYDVGLNGRGYMLDHKAPASFAMESIQIARAQADQSDSPSEASLSRDDLWRRSIDSHHHGQGQLYFDRPNSDQYRFRSSFGVNVWTRDALTLLPASVLTDAGASAAPLLVSTMTHLYAAIGSTIRVSTTGTTFSTATYAGGTVTGLASDGTTIYATDGADVYSAAPGGAFSVLNTLNCTLLGFVNGRLMAANGPSLYNITVPATPPVALYTHPNASWVWTAFASGPKVIYAAGYAGDKSLIYQIPILADGSGLDQPVVALQVPDGELVNALEFYLGFLAIGSTKGLRIATGDNLIAGPPLPVGSVRCLDGDDRWVYFGWSNFTATYTGLGRAGVIPGIELSAFTDSLTPAYASDLMGLGQGVVTATASFAGRRVFAVAGLGVFIEANDGTLMAGWVDSGWITFGLPDRKVLEWVDIRTEPLVGSVTAQVTAADGIAHVLSPVHNVQSTIGIVALANELTSDRFELRTNLAAAATSPNVARSTLFANPAPTRSRIWTLPLLLAENVDTIAGPDRFDSSVEREFIQLLCDSGTLVGLQIGIDEYRVFIEDYQWLPSHRYEDNSDWNGTLIVTAKEPSRRAD